jgi:hypothetical protein
MGGRDMTCRYLIGGNPKTYDHNIDGMEPYMSMVFE